MTGAELSFIPLLAELAELSFTPLLMVNYFFSLKVLLSVLK